jgi:phage tail sheath protein FI
MPEYLAPGVYVEEVSFRAKSIEGLSTTTTGFVGPTRFGPTELPLDVITSIGEFERTYGDRQQMQFGSPSSPSTNFMWQAARAFFEEGGTRLYISRVFRKLASPGPGQNADGYATGTIQKSGTLNATDSVINLRARFQGDFGNMRVTVTLRLGPNVLGQDSPTGPPVARGLLDKDIVVLAAPLSSPVGGLGVPLLSPPTSPLSSNAIFASAESFFDTTNGRPSWRFRSPAFNDPIMLDQLVPNPDPTKGDEIRVITATVTIFPRDPNLATWVYSGLALDSTHKISGQADSIAAQFSETPDSLGAARTIPIVVSLKPGQGGTDNGMTVLNTLFAASRTLQTSLLDEQSSDVDRSIDVVLAGGNDGERPGYTEYEGEAAVGSTTKTGLVAFEDIDEISIVAAPGSTFGYQGSYRDDASTILNLLIAHAARMKYRIAVLDSGDGQSIADVRALRAKIDSTYAALYYPWIKILDPVTRKEIDLPPSGFVSGIYARNDINRAVYKAPANEVVNLAIGFETLLNKAQQDILNPLGINCFRFFEGRGFRLWGARTISSDPEWKYVNLRRYFAYLEHSIDKGTQWAVFEPNGELLWANVRRTISDFLLNEWQNGALLGDKPEKAYFVRCDRSTMTQNDLDNGRLVCLIGVSALRPAEYVIFRIGQWTADARN